jgi:hypothetical protein
MLLSEDWFQAGKETASAQRRSHQVHLPEATWMTVHMYKLGKNIQPTKKKQTCKNSSWAPVQIEVLSKHSLLLP